MLEEEWRAAITSVDASTSAINGQAEILRSQQRHLDSIRIQRVEPYPRSRSRQLEAQDLALAVEESSQSLAAQLRLLEEGLHSQVKQVPLSARGRLGQDDGCLQQLAAAAVGDADDGQDLTAKVDQLTAKLSDFTRQELENRLNRIYLEQLSDAEGDGIFQHGEFDESQLEQDLKSLYVEISDVAAMSAAQGFKAPLLHAITEQQNRKQAEARIVLSDVSDSMTSLIEAMESWNSKLETLKSHQSAISMLRKDFDALAMNFATQVHRRILKKHAPKQTESSAVRNMLSHWDISGSENDSVEKSLSTRERRLEQDVERGRIEIEAALQEHLNISPSDFQRLVTTDTAVEKVMSELEEDLQKLKEGMETMDLVSGEQADCPARFVARWGGP